MQSYPINLIGGAGTSFQSTARRFVYESGVNAVQGNDSRIVVKPGSGNEIVLRAGQSFALPEGQHAEQWNIRPYDATATITGVVIIGSGEFDDNSFKIDANSGTVPVSIGADLTDMYTSSWVSYGVQTAGQVTELVSAAANVRGIRIHHVMAVLTDQTNIRQALMTKVGSTPPNDGTATDSGAGTDIVAHMTGMASSNTYYEKHPKLVVPPGRSLYWVACAATTNALRTVKFSVL